MALLAVLGFGIIALVLATLGFGLVALVGFVAALDDMRRRMAGFNAANPDHALGLFLEAVERLKCGEREGLALFVRAIALDPDATGAACERAHAWLSARGEEEQAETWAERWRMHAA